MEITPELLVSALVPKAESTGNNKKKKNEHYKNENVSSTSNKDDNDESKAKLVEKRSNWVEKDRRSTNDRRKKMAKRGRWLESRNTKDRRQSDKKISITI